MRNAPRNGGEHEEPPRYAVIVSDLADAEAREAHQWLQENYSQDYADRWLEGLTRAIEGLAVMPRRHAVARENDLYDVEVRRMLYFGPSKRHRRSLTAYRVLFHVIEPTAEDAEGVVRVLHIWHGALGENPQ